MSQTPEEPTGSPVEPHPPPQTPHRSGPEPTPPPTPEPPAAQWAAQAQGAPQGGWQGPAQPRRSMWAEAVSTTGGKVAVIVAAVCVALAGLAMAGLVVGAVARFVDHDQHGPWAGDTERAPMPERTPPGQEGRDQLPPGLERRGDAGDIPGLGQLLGQGPLHGEAVVPGDDTATRTILFQRGEVTEVTEDKLTVKSTDGFSATYTIGADSQKRLRDKVSTLNAGDQVSVIADKGNNTTLRILKTGRAGAAR